jgi:hypothetical protein
MATRARDLDSGEDLLDRYLRARMRLEPAPRRAQNPRARTCPRCGEHFEARFTDGNWTLCPFCRRYV